jgi:hypothetical protein
VTSEPAELTLLLVAVKCAPEVAADAVPAARAMPKAATAASSANVDFLIDSPLSQAAPARSSGSSLS